MTALDDALASLYASSNAMLGAMVGLIILLALWAGQKDKS